MICMLYDIYAIYIYVNIYLCVSVYRIFVEFFISGIWGS